MIKLQASWLSPKSIVLTWSRISSDPATDYSGQFYVVQRSEIHNEGFVNISSPLAVDDAMSFIDSDHPHYNETAIFYYRIQRKNLQNEVLETSVAEYARRDRSFIALEIIRRTNLLLRRFSGIRAFLFIKRTHGLRCSYCWDPIKERKMRSNCSECLGTGYMHGYASAIPILLSKNPSLHTKSIEAIGPIEDVSALFFTSNYPILKPGDIFVLDSQQFFRIDQVSPINFRETIVMQNLQCIAIEKSRELNNLVVPSFSEFDDMDNIHRQYGGLSGDTLSKVEQNKLQHGEFYIHEEGTQQ